jgi:hypothetical protein
MMMATNEAILLPEQLWAVNIGLEIFADDLQAQHVPVVRLQWQPPAGGAGTAMALERLLDESSENR